MLFGNDPRTRGALVTGLANRNSPAAAAGMLPDDLIVEVDGQPIRDMGHLMRVIGNAMAGSTVHLKVQRDGTELAIAVELKSRPAELNIP